MQIEIKPEFQNSGNYGGGSSPRVNFATPRNNVHNYRVPNTEFPVAGKRKSHADYDIISNGVGRSLHSTDDPVNVIRSEQKPTRNAVSQRV